MRRCLPSADAVYLAALGCLLALLGSCADANTTPIDVEVLLPESLDAEAARVEIFVVESCEDVTPGQKPSEWIASAYKLRDEGLGGLGTRFPFRSYGVYAVAQAEDCAVIAQSCEQVDLASMQSETLVVTLDPWSGQGCPEDNCSLLTGLCELEPVEDCTGAPEEASCVDADGARGRCRNQSCCTGCWNGVSCETGDAPERCGIAGAGCQQCECESDACVEGECAPTPAYAAVSAGEEHSCAIADTGELYCWGGSRSGELGLGDVELESCGSNTRCATQPSLVTFEIDGKQSLWTEVSAGHDATCGILASDASLWCWGSNASGRMGAPQDIDSSAEPHQVSVGSFLELELEEASGCAIGSDKSLWCWGYNAYGQANPSSPGDTQYEPGKLQLGQKWREVAMGYRHVCAVEDDGALWCWGYNSDGQVGIGASSGTEAPRALGRTASSVAAFNNSSCAQSGEEGLLCWGQNTQGQLGTEDESGADALSPTKVAGGHSFEQVSGGEAFACGVTESGTLFCWGQNNYRQLGIGEEPGAVAKVYVPTRVGSRHDWVSVSAGDRHACALRENGTLWCWGRNNQGQLGLAHRDDSSSPSRVCLSQTLAVTVDETGTSGPSALK